MTRESPPADVGLQDLTPFSLFFGPLHLPCEHVWGVTKTGLQNRVMEGFQASNGVD